MSPRSRSMARTSASGTTSEDRFSCGAATFEPNIPLGTTSASTPIVSPPAASCVTGNVRWKGLRPPLNPVESQTKPSPPSHSSSSTGKPAQSSGIFASAEKLAGSASSGQKSPSLISFPSPPSAEKRHSSMRLSLALRQSLSSSMRRAWLSRRWRSRVFMNLLLVGITTRPRYYMLSSISHATRPGAGLPPGAITSVERDALRRRLSVFLFLLVPLGPLEEGSYGVHAFVLQYVHHPPVGQGPFHRAQPEGARGAVPPWRAVHALVTVEHDRRLHLLPCRGVQHGLF